MKRTHRSVWLFLGLVAGLALVCTLGVSTAEKVKLTIYGNWPTDDKLSFPVFQQYLREYERLHPGISIEDLGREHSKDKVLTMLVGGSKIDMVAGGMIADLYEAGFIAEVPPDLERKFKLNFFPVAVEGGTIRGRFFGIPAQNNVLALFYNKRLMAEAGLPADPPKTWRELSEVGKRAVKHDAQGNMTRPGLLMQGPSPDDAWALDYTGTTMFLSEGGQVVDEAGKLAVDGAPLRLVISTLKEWYDSFLHLDYWKFASGKGVLMLGFSWQVSDLRRSYNPSDPSAHKTEVALCRVPAGSAGAMSLQFGNMYGVVNGSGHEPEVWRLLDWLFTAKTASGLTPMGHVFSTRGYPPIHRDDVRAIPRFEDAPYYMALIDNLEVAFNTVRYKPYGLGTVPVGRQVQDVFANKISPEQAMANIVRSMQNSMDEYAKRYGGK